MTRLPTRERERWFCCHRLVRVSTCFAITLREGRFLKAWCRRYEGRARSRQMAPPRGCGALGAGCHDGAQHELSLLAGTLHGRNLLLSQAAHRRWGGRGSVDNVRPVAVRTLPLAARAAPGSAVRLLVSAAISRRGHCSWRRRALGDGA